MAEPPEPAQTPPASSGNPWIIPLLVLVAGRFMSVLDIRIANVAITMMQNDFGATTDEMQQAQASAGRSGMVDASAMGGMSGAGAGAATDGAMMQQNQVYSEPQSQVFTTAMNDLLYVTAIEVSTCEH